LKIAKDYNASRFTQAAEGIAEVLAKIDTESTEEGVLITRAIFTHWSAKVAFTSGDFLSAYKHV